MERYDLYRTYGDGTRGPFLGYAMRYDSGWIFFPWRSYGHRPSRKYHPTMKRCIPRWVGYPDHCESVLNPLVTA